MNRIIEYLKPHEPWHVLCGDLAVYSLIALVLNLMLR